MDNKSHMYRWDLWISQKISVHTDILVKYYDAVC